jgi:hypothetical protein
MFGFINDRDARLILLLFIYFGEAEGQTASRFVLKNQSGMDATITNYVQSIKITSGVRCTACT